MQIFLLLLIHRVLCMKTERKKHSTDIIIESIYSGLRMTEQFVLFLYVCLAGIVNGVPGVQSAPC